MAHVSVCTHTYVWGARGINMRPVYTKNGKVHTLKEMQESKILLGFQKFRELYSAGGLVNIS